MDRRASFCAGDRFEVRARLGAGGMGVVYEAYDRELRQLVALKTLRHADSRLLARFKREFRSLHDVAHRNIVALGEFFDTESEPFFTMELLRGVNFLAYVRGPAIGTLDDLVGETADTAQLVRGGASRTPARSRIAIPSGYDEARLRAALAQLVVGLAALHRTGKVHRDVKPTNILVTDEGRVVLLDFGLVTEIDPGRQSLDGRPIGTVDYMAPEQALAGDVTPAADWYSVGVLLYEALTGVQPYTGRTPYEVLLRKQQCAPPPPGELALAVPADLDALCARLLEPEAVRRPEAGEIFDLLGVAVRQRATTDGSPRSARAATRPPTRPLFVGRVEELRRLRAGYERGGGGSQRRLRMSTSSAPP